MVPCACLHPKRIFNPYSKEWMSVPCGKCEACTCSKGFRLSERLGETIARYAYKYFVTLTFDDEHLPVARYDASVDAYVHPYDCDYNGVVYSVPKHIVDLSCSNKDFAMSLKKYGGVPVLSRRLLINFKKRLRKHFAKLYGKEYLFIYGVGEYGPTTLRPHYHLVLCTNAPVTANALESCVSKAWSTYNKASSEYDVSFGIIDFQRIISKGVRSYVAQYVNCVTSLPPVYSSGDFSTFYQSSPLIDTDCLRYKQSSLGELFFKCSPEVDCVSMYDNSLSTQVLPLGIINRVFPKCYKFSQLLDCDRVSLYSAFERFPCSTAKEFADLVYDCFCPSNDTLGLCKQLFVDNDIYASKQRLIRHYYLSRKVCLNASKLGVPLPVYVSQIDKFWSRYELMKLKHFYELQDSLTSDKFNPVGLSDLFALYYDTDDNLKNIWYYVELFGFPSSAKSLDALPVQANYSSLMRKIALDSTKTKKRNDYFEKNGWRRPKHYLNSKNLRKCQTFFVI